MMWETEKKCSWIAQGHDIFQMVFQEDIWGTMTIKTPKKRPLLCEQNIAVLSPYASHLYGNKWGDGGGIKHQDNS